MVTIGDTAIFHCNAKGSNISVRWIINGLSCNPSNCEQNGTYISTRTDNNSLMINTTLEIRTGEFHLVIMMKYTIQCIVEQHLDSSSLRGNNNITVTLIVNPQQVTGSNTGEDCHATFGPVDLVHEDKIWQPYFVLMDQIWLQ